MKASTLRPPRNPRVPRSARRCRCLRLRRRRASAHPSSAPATKRHEWFIASITRITELIKAGCLDVSRHRRPGTEAAHHQARKAAPAPWDAWRALGNTTAMSERPPTTRPRSGSTRAASADTDRRPRVRGDPGVVLATRLRQSAHGEPLALLAACTARVGLYRPSLANPCLRRLTGVP